MHPFRLSVNLQLAVTRNTPRPPLPRCWPANDRIVAPDVVLDFYGDVYRANPVLAKRGITFEAFVSRALRKAEAGSNSGLMLHFFGALQIPPQYTNLERSHA